MVCLIASNPSISLSQNSYLFKNKLLIHLRKCHNFRLIEDGWIFCVIIKDRT